MCFAKAEIERSPWKLFSTWYGCLRARNYLSQESDDCTCTLYGQRWEHSNHYLYRYHLHFLIPSREALTQKSLVTCSYWVCEMWPVQVKLCFRYKIHIRFKTLGPKEIIIMWNISLSIFCIEYMLKWWFRYNCLSKVYD